MNGSERSAGLERGTREQLISASARARWLDREIAERLDRRGPTGRPASREYLERLDARPVLTAEHERQLVIRAKRGDARARGELIEAFLPLVAATARNYRASAAVERLDAGRLGVSAERVRQIEERALSKLRAGAHGARSGADAA